MTFDILEEARTQGRIVRCFELFNRNFEEIYNKTHDPKECRRKIFQAKQVIKHEQEKIKACFTMFNRTVDKACRFNSYLLRDEAENINRQSFLKLEQDIEMRQARASVLSFYLGRNHEKAMGIRR